MTPSARGAGGQDAERTIRALLEKWVIWRDAGHWDRFRTVWHDDGVMMATWFQGTADEFIRVNIEGWKRGVRILHFLGGTAIEIAGSRAVAQTKMTIALRQLDRRSPRAQPGRRGCLGDR